MDALTTLPISLNITSDKDMPVAAKGFNLPQKTALGNAMGDVNELRAVNE